MQCNFEVEFLGRWINSLKVVWSRYLFKLKRKATGSLCMHDGISFLCTSKLFPLHEMIMGLKEWLSYMSLWCAALHLELKKEQSWHTVEHWFNKVPMNWGNLFVILSVRYIKNLNLTNFQVNNQNVCYIEVYFIDFQCPASVDLNNYFQSL